MAQPKVSIKWPSVASVKRRLLGLSEIEARILKSQPQPFYGQGEYVKGKWVWNQPPQAGQPEGKKWTQMRWAVAEMRQETEALLTLTQESAKLRRQAKKKAVKGAEVVQHGN